MSDQPIATQPHGEGAARDEFLAALRASLASQSFVKLVLAKYAGDEVDLQQVAVRPVILRGEPRLSFTYRYKTKDVTKNFKPGAAAAKVGELLRASFRNAHLQTTDETVDLTTNRRGESTLNRKKAVSDGQPAPEHNRTKRRHVALDRPFWALLGVTDGEGRLIPALSRKWKQIDKFVEVFASALASSTLADARTLCVMDFGAGKGYLTFALHDYLQHTLGVNAQVTGVELRPELVQLCNDAAKNLAMEGLRFEQGDVTHYKADAIEVMIALHACDTATDHAIHMGIKAGAAIIVCAPCCHKEVRPQLLSPHPIRAILKHGVHLGQEADMVTDGLRALLLEANGYATQVFEFVALEHTSKNKMILAVRRADSISSAPLLAQVAEVKQFYGIKELCLERLLAAPPGS
ncbi:MAG: SAM-dependent methyltransferase [Betaproteobacteria bacterium]|nr:SAM-dependent methyltransferase [Betaproteobacteria bacterium]